jgi:hypothetical protein
MIKSCLPPDQGTSRKRGREGPQPSEDQRGLDKMSKHQQFLIEKLPCTSKHEQVDLWARIHVTQSKILEVSHKCRQAREKLLWQQIGAAKNCKNASVYWKLLKRIRLKKADAFPSYMSHEGKQLRDKQAIQDHINKFYKDLSEGVDEEATTFKANAKSCSSTSTEQDREHAAQLKKNKAMNGRTRETSERLGMNDNFTLAGTIKAINKAKHGANGPDKVSNECLKFAPVEFVQRLTNLMQAFFDKGVTPVSLHKSVTKLLYKKGDSTNIRNYRPITLLNSIFKIWERLLEQRLRVFCEANTLLSPLQNGSRADKGTIETILAMNILESENDATPSYYAQVDLSKAYNRVNRTKLWNLLYTMGIRGKLWVSIMSTYDKYTENISIGSTLFPDNSLPKGLRQGSVLSPLLFIIYINPLILLIQEVGEGYTLNTEIQRLACLMFVDDLVLFSKTKEGLKRLLDQVIDFAMTNDCIINIDKSTVHSSVKGAQLDGFTCNRSSMGMTSPDISVYLGRVNNPTSSNNSEHIKSRQLKGNAILYTMINRGLNMGNLDSPTCANIVETIVIPTAAHAYEALNLSKSEIESIDHYAARSVNTIHGTRDIKAPPVWALYEELVTPPSILIEKAQIRIYLKNVCLTKDGQERDNILSSVMKAHPSNFFTTRAQELIENGMDTTRVQLESDRFKKFRVKRLLRDYVIKRQTDTLSSSLPRRWFRGLTEDTIPTTIDDSIKGEIRASLKRARAAHLFDTNITTCLLCNQHPATMEHMAFSCDNTRVTKIRRRFLRSIASTNPKTSEALQHIKDTEKVKWLLGLIRSKDSGTTKSTDSLKAKYVHKHISTHPNMRTI